MKESMATTALILAFFAVFVAGHPLEGFKMRWRIAIVAFGLASFLWLPWVWKFSEWIVMSNYRLAYPEVEVEKP